MQYIYICNISTRVYNIESEILNAFKVKSISVVVPKSIGLNNSFNGLLWFQKFRLNSSFNGLQWWTMIPRYS